MWPKNVINQIFQRLCYLISILDIPVYKSRIQSLHVFFSLYSAFKHSQHFNLLAHEADEYDESNQMLIWRNFF